MIYTARCITPYILHSRGREMHNDFPTSFNKIYQISSPLSGVICHLFEFIQRAFAVGEHVHSARIAVVLIKDKIGDDVIFGKCGFE